MSAPERPSFVTNDHLAYLDDLRESGLTNMFGAAPYVVEEFPDLDIQQARQALSYWAKTFGIKKAEGV